MKTCKICFGSGREHIPVKGNSLKAVPCSADGATGFTGENDIVELLDRQADSDEKAGTLYSHVIARNAIQEIERLRDEVQALRQDAERYRWLRDQHWSSGSLTVTHPKSVVLGCDTYSLHRLDGEIDFWRKRAKT